MDINLLLNIILFIGMVSFLCMSIYRRNRYNKIKKELDDLKNTPVPTMTITTKRADVINLEKDYMIPKYELDLSDLCNSAMHDEVVNIIQKRMLNEMVDQIHPYVNYIYNYDPMRQVQVIRARLRVLK